MNRWLLVLTATAILLILICRVNLYINLRFSRRADDDYLAITVYALRKLFIYSIKIPTITLTKHDKLPWVASEIKTPQNTAKTKVNREQRFLKKTIKLLFYEPERFWRLFKLAKYIFRGYRNYMDKLSTRVHCEKFELKANYGFDDAALTGIFMGIWGAVFQLLLTAMYNRIELDIRPSIQLQPNYKHRQFELELSCIFRIRLGNVITATIAVLRNLSRTEATGSG
jgi:hypothetical protein